MANVENSFEDRLGRGMSLKTACAGFVPLFAPNDNDLTVSEQQALLVTLDGCCTNVSSAVTDLKVLTDPRAASVKDIKERATRALNRVESTRSWAAKLPIVKAAADKLRALVVPQSTLPPEPTNPDAPAPVKRDRGGESYKDVEGKLFKFIGALTKCPLYDTGCPEDITIPAFSGLYTTLKLANEEVDTAEVALQEIRIDRLRRFEGKVPMADGSTSLRDRFKRIKKAVASQYGRKSAQFELVQSMNY